MGVGSFGVGEIEVQLVSEGEFHYPVEACFVGASAEERTISIFGNGSENA